MYEADTTWPYTAEMCIQKCTCKTKRKQQFMLNIKCLELNAKKYVFGQVHTHTQAGVSSEEKKKEKEKKGSAGK